MTDHQHKPADKSVDKPADKSVDKPADKSVDKPIVPLGEGSTTDYLETAGEAPAPESTAPHPKK
jgi:hypothetical protein